jgi:hypothetical protein
MAAAVVTCTAVVMAAAVMTTAVMATVVTAMRSGFRRQRQKQCCGDCRYECQATQHAFHSSG